MKGKDYDNWLTNAPQPDADEPECRGCAECDPDALRDMKEDR